MELISYVMRPRILLRKKTFLPQIAADDTDSLLLRNSKKVYSGFNAPFKKQNDGREKIVLIADDDPAIIDILTLMLEPKGYRVFASGNLETMADVYSVSPDLILLDILMSGANGRDICKTIKDDPSTRHIPVIIMSAASDAKEIALNAFADDFIAKPFEMHTLLQKVARYIKV